MRLSDFDYHLPAAAIAQAPLDERDASRMMVVLREGARVEDRLFRHIDTYLGPGDVLVVNDSRVIPARLSGMKATGSNVEILLLKRRDRGEDPLWASWDCLLKPGKRMRQGVSLHFDEDGAATVTQRLTDKTWRLDFSTRVPFDEFLRIRGTAPLPPYIKRKNAAPSPVNDLERYQTVYARVPGSVAAPTAGFHFTPPVLEALKRKGVTMTAVTLHVGYGTFLPIVVEEVERHRMEAETYELTPEAAAEINAARRVVAVGTTATRVVETLADKDGIVRPGTGETDLYIYPGYRFKRVNALLTNFHLPKSSLYLLASAFAGPSLLREAYGHAIRSGYRFYSYGDCTLIL